MKRQRWGFWSIAGLVSIPIWIFGGVMVFRAIGGPLPTPPAAVQVSARLCAMSTTTPYLRGGEHVGTVSTTTLDLAGPFAKAGFSDSTEVGARAGERHAFVADVMAEQVAISLTELGAAVLDGQIATAILSVENQRGESARASIGVSLDTARLSPSLDGGC